jgi:germination protein M
VDTKPVEQYVVSELIKGPKIKGNERLLATDTKVLSVEITDRICYVNFKEGFLEKNAAASGGSKLVVDSIVKSLTGLNNVDSVQFLIDGKKADKIGDTDISGLFVKEEPKEMQ